MSHVFALLFLILSSHVLAHKGKDHSKKEPQASLRADPFIEIYKEIASSYKSKIEPIFKAKCFDCHMSNTNFPWYYQIPGVNLIINSHIKEARSHLDMTEGFPFKGHGTPVEDLKELSIVIEKGSMPPWYYTPFHKNSEIAVEEKKIILSWIDESLNKLEVKK